VFRSESACAECYSAAIHQSLTGGSYPHRHHRYAQMETVDIDLLKDALRCGVRVLSHASIVSRAVCLGHASGSHTTKVDGDEVVALPVACHLDHMHLPNPCAYDVYLQVDGASRAGSAEVTSASYIFSLGTQKLAVAHQCALAVVHFGRPRSSQNTSVSIRDDAPSSVRWLFSATAEQAISTTIAVASPGEAITALTWFQTQAQLQHHAPPAFAGTAGKDQSSSSCQIGAHNSLVSRHPLVAVGTSAGTLQVCTPTRTVVLCTVPIYCK
jgi:hypothetical protein